MMADLGCKGWDYSSAAYRRVNSPVIPEPLDATRFRDLSTAQIKKLLRERLAEERRLQGVSETSAKQHAARAAEIEAMLT